MIDAVMKSRNGGVKMGYQ